MLSYPASRLPSEAAHTLIFISDALLRRENASRPTYPITMDVKVLFLILEGSGCRWSIPKWRGRRCTWRRRAGTQVGSD
eukprot:3459780-Rhodomonas_salina.1